MLERSRGEDDIIGEDETKIMMMTLVSMIEKKMMSLHLNFPHNCIKSAYYLYCL